MYREREREIHFREKEKEKERHTQTHTQRQTNKQTDRQANGQTVSLACTNRGPSYRLEESRSWVFINISSKREESKKGGTVGRKGGRKERGQGYRREGIKVGRRVERKKERGKVITYKARMM